MALNKSDQIYEHPLYAWSGNGNLFDFGLILILWSYMYIHYIQNPGKLTVYDNEIINTMGILLCSPQFQPAQIMNYANIIYYSISSI